MSWKEEVDVSLTWLHGSFDELQVQAAQQRHRAETTQQRLDAIDARLATHSPETPRRSRRQAGGQDDERVEQPVGAGDWTALLSRARRELAARGCDPSTVNLDALLDEEEARRIDRRMRGGFQVHTRLDCYDVLAAVVAGVAAALVDALIVKIPSSVPWDGSALTAALRNHAAEHDNWLANYAKISYDGVRQHADQLKGFGPTTHRVQTFGHDPLLGLVYGTIDILRGTITATSATGAMHVGDSGVDPVSDLPHAFALQLLHLLSDLPTRTGLPVPGWTALLTINTGSIGPKQETVGEVARAMYLRGFDTWHFATMTTSVAAASLTLRGYWGLRGHFDERWRETVDNETAQVGGDRVSDNPRFQTLSLIAHGLAAGANVGKVVLYGGNPLALNYPQWLWFTRAFLAWYAGRLAEPASLLTNQAEANSRLLDDGWPRLDPNDEAFPRLQADPG